jgi:hypothetical protein
MRGRRCSRTSEEKAARAKGEARAEGAEGSRAFPTAISVTAASSSRLSERHVSCLLGDSPPSSVVRAQSRPTRHLFILIHPSLNSRKSDKLRTILPTRPTPLIHSHRRSLSLIQSDNSLSPKIPTVHHPLAKSKPDEASSTPRSHPLPRSSLSSRLQPLLPR